jgi:dCTP diphosphatase
MADDSLKKLMRDALKFRDAREWKQFHNFKDLAITLSLEAAELLEHAQWKSPAELEKHLKERRDEVADELSDVLHMVLLLAEHCKIDLAEAFARKMRQNERKYPVHKARGTSKKYNEL